MSADRIDAQLAAVVGGAGEELTGLVHGQLIGGDVGRHVGALALAVLQVGSVAPHSQGDALADLDGVDGASIDLAEVVHQALESLGPQRGGRVELAGGRSGLLNGGAGGSLPVVEAPQPGDPILLTGSDPVQVALHGGGEVVVDELGEVLLQQPGDGEGEPGRHQGLAAVVDVAAVGDRGHGGRVGRGAADLALLKGLDQGGLGVARRRRRLVTRGLSGQRGQLLAGDHRGQPHVLGVLSGGAGVLLVALGVAALLVGGQEAAEGDHGARRRQTGGREGGARVARLAGRRSQRHLDGHGGGRADGVGHLGGHGPLPDELVEAELGTGQLTGDLGRGAEVIAGGADRLVGLLGALGLGGVDAGALGDVLGPVELGDLRAGRGHGLTRQDRGIGTHVGDEAVLVEALSHPHGLTGVHPQLAGGLLLEGGGGEGRGRTALVGLVLHAGDARLTPADGLGDSGGPHLVEVDGGGLDGGRAQLAVVIEVTAGGHAPPVEGDEAGGEGGVLTGGDVHRGQDGGEVGLHPPVGGRAEGHALTLTLDDEAGGHRLHAPGGQTGTDLAPQDRADLVAHEAVQDAAGLLGIDEVDVQVASVAQGPGDGLAGDLGEDHAAHRHLGLENLLKMPGDGLALAVVVGGQVELVGVLEGLLELGDRLLLVRVDHVVGREVVLDVNRELPIGTLLHGGGQLGGLREVPDVPHGGFDVELRTEVAGDGAHLVRGLHDDELGGHVKPSSRAVRGRAAPDGSAGGSRRRQVLEIIRTIGTIRVIGDP